ncbi:peptide ABC transporter permease [Pseudomonas protegens]|uniref:Peptide ABC transporter permease n=1 Tax=Pseudomonas protegens TaxID=380021 RepID=A0A2T6GSQ3_9PSED|nr:MULTISPECIES: ABC transporter permease [Pseudomonas]PUA47189.1 peptide ABC transporter permease [Pseudomonas protegens]RXU65496.1 peptide ABC transporter permease [Pseudomonas protegens]ULT67979.1 ABC transporter permease [Pseudomonas sp. BC42]
MPDACRKTPRTPAWLSWFIGRLGYGLLTAWVISLVVFIATQALPSDPARVILGPDAPLDSILTLQRQLGLDRPLLEQYLHWLGQTLRGDLGRSLDSDAPVAGIVFARLGYTLALLAGVMALVVPAALLLGVTLALRRDSRLDRWSLSLLILLKATPGFLLAIALVLLFSMPHMDLLPAVSILDPQLSLWRQLPFLVLPVLALGLSALPYLTRMVRAAMIEALESDYVIAARLRGIPERRIVWRHTLPNALVPAIQGVALTLRTLIGGALLAEVVFSYPGIGTSLNSAIQMRDLPMIQGIVLVITLAVVLINLLADLATVLLTPKLRTARRVSLIRRNRRGIQPWWRRSAPKAP